MDGFRPINMNDLKCGKIYFHYSEKLSNAIFFRLTEPIKDLDHINIVFSSLYNALDDSIVDEYNKMKHEDKLKLSNMFMDSTVHPDSVMAKECNIKDAKLVRHFVKIRPAQPRKEFFSLNILLEVTDIDLFPFKTRFDGDMLSRALKESEIRKIKLKQIFL